MCLHDHVMLSTNLKGKYLQMRRLRVREDFCQGCSVSKWQGLQIQTGALSYHHPHGPNSAYSDYTLVIRFMKLLGVIASGKQKS